MSHVLRPYQVEAADAIMREFETSDSTLLLLPTGCGKTQVFVEIARRFQPKRVMVLAHRSELIHQARARILVASGLTCEVEMAHMSAGEHFLDRPQVVVSTVQTQIAGNNGGRMTRFAPDDFGLVIVDEAHRAVSDSYRRVLAYYQKNPFLKVLGVTATADRQDEKAMGDVFKTVAYDYEILDAIRDGYLVPIEQQSVNIKGLDYSQIKTTAGDLNGGQLAEVMEAEENMQGVASATIQMIGDRRTIIFTASVRQAQMLSEILCRHRAGMAGWASGETEPEERADLLKRFASGATQVAVNCGLWLEGYDNPAIEVVVMAKPTKSRIAFSQMVGRGTRILPNVIDGIHTPEERRAAVAASRKPALTVLSFDGNAGKHKLISTADILGGKSSEAAITLAKDMAKKKSGPVQFIELLEDAEKELERRKQLAIEREQAEIARRARLLAKAQFTATSVDPFNVYDITPTAPRGWDQGKVLSEKQCGVLLKAGINPAGMPYHQAKQLLDETFRRWNAGLCTAKQAKLLKGHGYETKNLKMSEASKLIDLLAKNGWKRPPEPPPANGW